MDKGFKNFEIMEVLEAQETQDIEKEGIISSFKKKKIIDLVEKETSFALRTLVVFLVLITTYSFVYDKTDDLIKVIRSIYNIVHDK